MASAPLTPRSVWLQRWTTAVNQRTSRPVRVLHIGDSITEGHDSTLETVLDAQGAIKDHRLSGNWTGKEQTEFETKWNVSGQYTYGFEFVASFYRFASPNVTNATLTYTGARTQQQTNNNTAGGLVGKSRVMWSGSVATMFRYCTSVGVVVNLRSASAVVKVFIDDSATPAQQLTGVTGLREIKATGLSGNTLHKIVIQFSGVDTTQFHGVAVYRGTESKGIQVWGGGYSGSYTAQFSSPNLGPWENMVTLIQPDLIITSWLTNDMNNVDGAKKSPAAYQADTENLITKIRTVAPNALIMIQVPQAFFFDQSSPKNKYMGSYTYKNYTDTNHAVASKFANVFVEPMSDHIAKGVNLAGDKIHPTTAGYIEYAKVSRQTLSGDFESGTPPSDTTAPSIPTNFRSTAKSTNSVALAWTASTDNVGVTGYRIFRDGALIATLGTATTYTSTGLAANRAYTFTIDSFDDAGNYSSARASVSVTTNAAADTTAPTKPTLTAAVQSSTAVNLSWSGATDNVGITNYLVYSNGSLIATLGTSTTYAATGLSAGSKYTFTVRARDAAALLSDPSNAVTVTTTPAADTTDPTIPGALVKGAVTETTIALSWSASTDNVGVVGYQLFQNGTLKATVTGTSYTVTGLTAGATYIYVVKAYDAAGNSSDGTASLSVTTDQPPETIPPDAPRALSITNIAQTSLTLSWTQPNSGTVASYRIFRNGTQIAQGVTGTTYNATGLVAGTAYSFVVKAVDAGGLESNGSQAASATTSPPTDTQKPTAPSGLTAGTVTQTAITVSWTASTDNVGVAGYKVFVDGTVQTATTTNTTYTITGLSPNVTYGIVIKAYDAVGLNSDGSAALPVTTLAAADTENPTAPTGLTATDRTTTTVALSWNAAVDNVGVTRYIIYRGNETVAVVNAPTTTYTVTGLTAATTYTFGVRAADEAGNISGDPASTLQVMTLSNADTQAPSVPNGVTKGAVTETTIALTWNASTDNVGVTGYKIFRSGVQIATSATPSYTATGLTAGTSYSFAIKAYDAAGNDSNASASFDAATAQPAETLPPEAPTGLTATATTPTSISLSWTAPTGETVATYELFDNGVSVASGITAVSYTVTGLTANTQHIYVVKAVDTEGTAGPGSQALTVRTQTAPDTTAPSVPNGLAQSGTPTTTSITITWNPSTDAGSGVARYYVYKNGVKETTEPTATTYTYNGLTQNTSYSFAVKAIDVAGNLSNASAALSLQTDQAVDATAPTTPNGVVISGQTSTGLVLNWNPSTDAGSGVANYIVFRDGVSIATPTATTYTVTGLKSSTTYAFVIKAIDNEDNLSLGSGAAYGTTAAIEDTEAPSVPAGLVASNVTSVSLTLSWSASTDNVGVTAYYVYQNGVRIAITNGTTTNYNATNLAASTTYAYVVKAVDGAGNESNGSAARTVTTLSNADTQRPTVPGTPVATNITMSGVTLTWTAATDNVAVTGYEVYRNNVRITTVTGLTYTGTNLTPGTAYSYYVVALDAAGNRSNASGTRLVSTLPDPSTQPTDAPANLRASAITLTSITLQWDAPVSQPNGISNYFVRYGTEEVTIAAGTTQTTISDLEYGTSYTFTVIAADTNGTRSQPSVPLTASTNEYVDTTAPTRPTNLAVNQITDSMATLTWTASTDDSFVAAYALYESGVEVDRIDAFMVDEQGEAVWPATLTYIAAFLDPETTYDVYIRALDVAGNISSGSTPVSFTTTAAPAGSELKVWNGSVWNLGIVKVWNGTDWIERDAKVWNGTDWI